MIQATIHKDHYQTSMSNGRHEWLSDEPFSVGGQDSGPSPFDLFLGSLASCIAITLRMYADRKAWPVKTIKVTVNMDSERKNKHFVSRIYKSIEIEGDLDEQQYQRMLEIAGKCPVHRTMTGVITVEDEVPLV